MNLAEYCHSTANFQPNFVFIIEDEKRYMPPYELEDDLLVKMKKALFKGDRFLENNGVVFHNHQTEATACTPSRESIFLGKPMFVHGIDKTNGFDKHNDDPKMKWLSADKFKTMGHAMRNLGYDTFYVGKWHLTDEIDDLEEHGFSCPTPRGSEPHGPDINKRGKVMDKIYIDQAIEFIKTREKNNEKPFLLVISLVNPHDIVLYSRLFLRRKTTNTYNYNFPEAPDTDDVSTVAKLFSKKYMELMVPMWLHKYIHRDENLLKNFYFDMMLEADRQKNRFFDFFKQTQYYKNTYIICTADHGDMLFAKNLLQKWYVPYREAIHVPLIIHHPSIKQTANYNCLTSSLDILPTIIGLAIDEGNLGEMHNELYGRNLQPIINEVIQTGLYVHKADDFEHSVIFETNDDLFEGNNAFPIYYSVLPGMKNILKFFCGTNSPMNCPKYIRTIMSYENGQLYKLSKYFLAEQEEWELFNHTNDPNELVNIINDSSIVKDNIVDKLKAKMIIKFTEISV